jgi:hypothetical protein
MAVGDHGRRSSWPSVIMAFPASASDVSPSMSDLADENAMITNAD